MFEKTFILHSKGAFTPETCEVAIDYYEKRVDLHEFGRVGNQVDFDRKKCTEIYLKREEYSLFENTLEKHFKKYIKKYSFVNNLALWNFSPIFKIQKYNPGEGYFYTHCENDCKEQSYRVLVWMIYLNDVKDGGQTHFPYQNKKYQPRTGDVLIWPAYFTHPHRGIVSKNSTKYIATGWCEFI